jgi:hypothetical protein
MWREDHSSFHGNHYADLLLLQCSPQLEEMERFAEPVIKSKVMATAV